MVKIFTGNEITPKKKELFKWGFTTREGGTIRWFKFPESESAYNRMRDELRNERNWSRYPGPHPEGGRGSRNFTYLKIIPDFDCVKIHSVFFPDGRVWDSTIRNFRKIRDYEVTKK